MDIERQKRPHLIKDVFKRHGLEDNILEYVYVLLEPTHTEAPLDLSLVIAEEKPELLESPANEFGAPVKSMIRFDDSGSYLNFTLGDYQAVDETGTIVSVNNDYWGPSEIDARVRQIQEFVDEKYGESVKIRQNRVDARGHQRKGQGLVGYYIWAAQDAPIQEERFDQLGEQFDYMVISTDDANSQVKDDLRDRIFDVVKQFPGIYIDEHIYSYPLKFGQNVIDRTRNVFVLWKKFPGTADVDSLREEVTLKLFNNPADIRDIAYKDGFLYQAIYPVQSFRHNNEPDVLIDLMIKQSNVHLSMDVRDNAIKGLDVLVKELNNRQINLPDEDEETSDGDFFNIEIIDNVSDGFSERSIFKELKQKPFLFGLNETASNKFNGYYHKQTLVVSLAYLISLGQKGSISDEEMTILEESIEETKYRNNPENERTAQDILNDMSLDQRDSALSTNVQKKDKVTHGGIYLNPQLLDLTVKRNEDANRFKNSALLEQSIEIDGLSPVIFQIIPVEIAPLLLNK